MKKVLLRGPLLTNSGYGVHSRQLFSWLYNREDIELSVECLNWGITSWILDKEFDNGIIGKIMECSKPLLDSKYDVYVGNTSEGAIGKKQLVPNKLTLKRKRIQ